MVTNREPNTKALTYPWTGEPDELDLNPNDYLGTGWLPWDERGSAMYKLSRVRARRFKATLTEV